MLTDKAAKEIAKLTLEKSVLESDRKSWADKADAAMKNHDWRTSEVFRKEARKVSDKIFKKDDRISHIQSCGISTSEENTLKREATDYHNDGHFVTISRDRSLGSTCLVKVGWSKVLNSFVVVSITKYDSFMRNVKGCSSMANTTHLRDMALLTEAEANEQIAKGCKVETNFIGHEEKVLPINKTAAELR